jgi:ribosome-binding factor A
LSYRIERINSIIREEISELLLRQVKDPRLGDFIAITDVTTTPDLKYAKVYVSQYGVDIDKKKILKALASASGFFRSALSKRLKMRYVPELHFEWDDSIEKGNRISQLIDEVNQQENTPKS